jgi:hypothetical protein
MIRSLSPLVLAISVAIACVSYGGVSAAQLHEVLPADSTERNGEQQPLVEHRARVSSIAALPGGGVHPNAAVGLERLVCRGATEQLEAYDAGKLGVPIFAANAGVWVGNNTGRAYVAPLVANGRVYVGAYKTVTVFGLTN